VVEHLPSKQRVAGSIPVSRSRYDFLACRAAKGRSFSWRLRAMCYLVDVGWHDFKIRIAEHKPCRQRATTYCASAPRPLRRAAEQPVDAIGLNQPISAVPFWASALYSPAIPSIYVPRPNETSWASGVWPSRCGGGRRQISTHANVRFHESVRLHAEPIQRLLIRMRLLLRQILCAVGRSAGELGSVGCGQDQCVRAGDPSVS
jgi:hypothetical protein